MKFLDRAIEAVAPGAGFRRARARAALKAMMNYDAATTGRRASSWRASGADADAAAARRARIAAIARDMIRNTPLAKRAESVIAANVVGMGIAPKVEGGTKGQAADLTALVTQHLETTAIDADGRQTLFGLQNLVMKTIVDSGEVLIRRRFRDRSDGLALALQLQVLEPDYIDTARVGPATNGNQIREGIEYDAIGRRVAYYLFDEHPGSAWRPLKSYTSRRVAATEILHLFWQDRPGQMRGVSWFHAVAMRLQDLADGQDAQLMRQKIAACFAGFRTMDGADDPDNALEDIGTTITPGTIRQLKPGEDITFASPPKVDGYDDFTRAVLREVAAGIGITFEALSGDLSNVNFTSYKAGRIEMDLNVRQWQWLMMVPQMMEPIGRWIIQQWAIERGIRPARGLKLTWTAPVRPLIDPAREIGALRDKVRAGFASRQGVVRELGDDPSVIFAEQVEDAALADEFKLKFDSDARMAIAGQAKGSAPDDAPDDDRPEKKGGKTAKEDTETGADDGGE